MSHTFLCKSVLRYALISRYGYSYGYERLRSEYPSIHQWVHLDVWERMANRVCWSPLECSLVVCQREKENVSKATPQFGEVEREDSQCQDGATREGSSRPSGHWNRRRIECFDKCFLHRFVVSEFGIPVLALALKCWAILNSESMHWYFHNSHPFFA